MKIKNPVGGCLQVLPEPMIWLATTQSAINVSLPPYKQKPFWRPSSGDPLRSGAHVLDVRSAPVLDDHRHTTRHNDFCNSLPLINVAHLRVS